MSHLSRDERLLALDTHQRQRAHSYPRRSRCPGGAVHPGDLCRGQLRRQHPHNFGGDLVLNRKDVGQLPVEAVGPQERTILGVDQSATDANAAAGPRIVPSLT